MRLKGIDVSHHQGVINWDKVKSQIDYAILSVGYGDNIPTQDDEQFHRNAKECVRLGLPFGVYIYSYATSLEQAKSEANHVLRMIRGYKLNYPIYYDLEDSETTGKCSNKLIADMAELFCNIIEKEKYWVGIYANTYWFTNKLTDKRFNRWTRWVAQYNNNCTYQGKYDMWQYSSLGVVSGIKGNVDMNYSYKDFPTVIQGKEKPIVKSGQAKVRVEVLNIRNKPSVNGTKVGEYYKGETFNFSELIKNEGYWWAKYVSWGGNLRYVAIENIKDGVIYAIRN